MKDGSLKIFSKSLIKKWNHQECSPLLLPEYSVPLERYLFVTKDKANVTNRKDHCIRGFTRTNRRLSKWFNDSRLTFLPCIQRLDIVLTRTSRSSSVVVHEILAGFEPPTIRFYASRFNWKLVSNPHINLQKCIFKTSLGNIFPLVIGICWIRELCAVTRPYFLSGELKKRGERNFSWIMAVHSSGKFRSLLALERKKKGWFAHITDRETPLLSIQLVVRGVESRKLMIPSYLIKTKKKERIEFDCRKFNVISNIHGNIMYRLQIKSDFLFVFRTRTFILGV